MKKATRKKATKKQSNQECERIPQDVDKKYAERTTAEFKNIFGQNETALSIKEKRLAINSYFDGYTSGKREQRNSNAERFNERQQEITQLVLDQINTMGNLFQKLFERYDVDTSPNVNQYKALGVKLG